MTKAARRPGNRPPSRERGPTVARGRRGKPRRSGDQNRVDRQRATNWNCTANAATFIATDGTDVCSGIDEVTVSGYACSSGDAGAVSDTCSSHEEARNDLCADTGDALGGGSCAAADWSCAGNALTLASTAGTDVCAGTPESPVVTSYACTTAGEGSVANTCASHEETRFDTCSDTGSVLGGGTCAATDWSCVGGATLASTGTSGTDVCGGTPENPSVTSYRCLNGNQCEGAANDCPAPLEQECRLAACAPDPGAPELPGACSYGARPEFTPCGDPGEAVCTSPDSCDANGVCLPRNEPCGFVTSPELCSFDLDATLPERQFRTIFTAASDVWPGYGIGATNPGQFFYNAIVQGAPGAATITMDIPWPFVTRGATPVHVYDADAIGVAGEGTSFCFREDVDGSAVPPVNGTPYPAKITQELRANGGSDPGNGPYTVDCPVPGGPGAGDPCTVSISFEMPAAGQAYVNIHLDYGVKGAMTDANPVDGAPDRYDLGVDVCTGDARYRDAFVNTALRPSEPAYVLPGWTGGLHAAPVLARHRHVLGGPGVLRRGLGAERQRVQEARRDRRGGDHRRRAVGQQARLALEGRPAARGRLPATS